MTFLILLCVAIAIILAVALSKPDTFQVQRATTINAPPERVFGLINDFHQFDRWSPWEHLDPNMRREITGAAAGVGAVYAWSGAGKAGAGRMEIVQSTPFTAVRYSLHFLKPFDSKSITDWTLEPTSTGTRVTWTMHGPATLVSKVMQVFVSMDAMIGKDFESGLTKMKAVAERA
jgi:uncharacterized protein YndB with AHSA1/START domain